MAPKTRRTTLRKKKTPTSDIDSIPYIRHSIEYLEEFVKHSIESRKPKDTIVKELRTQWKQIFYKEIGKKSAEEYVEHMMTTIPIRRVTRKAKRMNGGQLGAPLDYTMRSGVYQAPGAIPPMIAGNYIDYVKGGFWNPEIAQRTGQNLFPSPQIGMGSNAVLKGGKHKRKQLRRQGGGLNGTVLSQAFQHPISGAVPPSLGVVAQNNWYGVPNNFVSPNQPQNQPQYQIGNNYPKVVTI
jgi:hypothetical protein